MSLESHFANSEPHVRALFDRLVRQVEKLGPVTPRPVRTRIGIQARMQFAAVMPRKSHLRGHLVLPPRPTEACFVKVEGPYGNEYVGVFELRSSSDIGALLPVLAESYELGAGG